MVKINYKQKIRFGDLNCGDTFLYNGILGMMADRWEGAFVNAIDLKTGVDITEEVEINFNTIVEKVDIEINIL